MLGDEVSFYSGLTYHPQDVKENGCFVVRSSNIKNSSIVPADNVYVSENIVNSEKVKKDDIIVVVRNGSRNLIGKHAMVNVDMSDTVIGAFMTGIRSSQNKYINALLDSDNFDREIHKNLGATINQITTGEFKKMKFHFTNNSDESHQIGILFSKLDNLIALYQRKLDLLKQLKKGLLQKMFANKDYKNPDLRFKEFKDNWEKLELGKLLSYEQPNPYIVSSNNYDSKFTVPVLTAGKSFILGFTNEENGIKKADRNNPVIIFDDFTTSSHYVDFPFKVKSSALKILSRKNESINTKFVYEVLSRIKYIPQSHERHWISQFSKFNVMITNSSEQYRISYLLTRSDDLINSCQKQINTLTTLKKYLLQQMFI